MDRQIVLDDKSFKALSADSRVNILKSLGERRRTLSELSQKLALGNSTIKEHCDILIGAELIKQIDEGRKWKYYELTHKGKQVVMPNLMDEVKVLIILCLGVIMIGGIGLIALQTFNGSMASAPLQNSVLDQGLMKKSATISDPNLLTEQITGTATTNDSVSRSYINENPTPSVTTEFFVLSMMISTIFGVLLGWVITHRH